MTTKHYKAIVFAGVGVGLTAEEACRNANSGALPSAPYGGGFVAGDGVAVVEYYTGTTIVGRADLYSFQEIERRGNALLNPIANWKIDSNGKRWADGYHWPVTLEPAALKAALAEI